MSNAMSLPYPEHPANPVQSVRHVHPAYTKKLTRPFYPAHEPLAAFVGAVSCPVCDAVYAPTQSHEHLLQAPAIALESAFMSMCRFCFRCRRPACPACWDAVNGLCGSCVQELALPFRQELAPFAGAFPIPTSSRQTASPAILHVPSSDAPLRCVYTGRFQQTSDALVAQALVATDPVPVAQRDFPAKEASAPTSTSNHSTQDDIEAQPTQPPVQQQGRSQDVPASRLAYVIERVFTTLFLTLLSIIILFVVGASLSPQMNTWVAHSFHIDIRALILTIWSAIHQLFAH
jgi:hypothetical protein